MARIVRFYCLITGFVFITHVSHSAVLSCVAPARYTHRIANVRRLDDQPWTGFGLERVFLKDAMHKAGNRPLMMFCGSSHTWAYPFSEEAAFSHIVSDALPDWHVINVSVIGNSLEGVRDQLKRLADANFRFDVVVLEVPVTNEVFSLYARSLAAKEVARKRRLTVVTECVERKEVDGRPLQCREQAYPAFNVMALTNSTVHELSGQYRILSAVLKVAHQQSMDQLLRWTRNANSYFDWFVWLPWGTHHWSVMWDEYSRCNGELNFAPIPVPEGFFLSLEQFGEVKELYRRNLLEMLYAAKNVAPEVYVFAGPVYVEGVAELGFDSAAIREQLEFTTQTCAIVSNVHVFELDDQFLSDRDCFWNVTHFNIRGNRRFGEWLLGKMESESNGSPVRIVRSTGDDARRRN